MNRILGRISSIAGRRVVWLPLLSGGLLALSFPDPAIFPLAWLALVPFLVFLLDRPSLREALIGHLLFTSLYLGGVLYWIPGTLNSYGGFGLIASGGIFLLLLLLLSIYFLPFTFGVKWAATQSHLLGLLAAPALWVVCEWLRTYFPAGGFPWGAVGYSQFPLKWLVQVVDLGGVYFISWLVLWGNVALATLLRARSHAPRIATGVLTAVLLANLYGLLAATELETVGQEKRVDLVQPMVLLSRDRDYYARKFFRELPDLFRRSAVNGADWVIFPEAPNPFAFGTDFYFTNTWKKLARDHQVPILLSSAYRDQEKRQRHNSTFLITSTGESTFRYDKQHLVPFGEYLPWGAILGFVRPMVQQVGGFSPGLSEQPLGEVGGIPFGVLICYESIFPSQSRRLAQRGARLIVNITNDHWFGETSAPTQHLQMAAFRAIETRRPILRAANSGYSALIRPDGSIESRSNLSERTIQSVRVQAMKGETLFVAWGQAWNLSLIMLNGLLLLLVGRRDGNRKDL